MQYKIEANHNKDYSVVKTFKAEGKPFVFLFVFCKLIRLTIILLQRNKIVLIFQTWRQNGLRHF